MLRILILLAVCAYASADLITSYDCANKTTFSRDFQIEVSDCSSANTHCPLYQGKTHSVVLHYVPTRDFDDKVDFRVYGVFEKFAVPYKGKSDAYENATYTDDNTKLRDVRKFFANREIRHTSNFAVSPNYPKIKLRVRFIVERRRTKQAIFCREIPVEIVSAPDSE